MIPTPNFDVPRKEFFISEKQTLVDLNRQAFLQHTTVAKLMNEEKEQMCHSESYIDSPELRYICEIIDLFFANKKVYGKYMAGENHDF